MNPLDVPPDPAVTFQPRSGQRGTGFLTEPFLNFAISAQVKQATSGQVALEDLLLGRHDDANMGRSGGGPDGR